MKVFLDTNVFYNDWYMRNANFKYLFHYLNNEGHDYYHEDEDYDEEEDDEPEPPPVTRIHPNRNNRNRR